MRIDKLLHALRLSKTRGAAQALVGSGILRLNGERVIRAHRQVSIGDVLTLPTDDGVRIVEILCLPKRRGPPGEARACYRDLDESTLSAIAGDETAHYAPREQD